MSLIIDNLSISYGDNRVLENVNISVKEGTLLWGLYIMKRAVFF